MIIALLRRRGLRVPAAGLLHLSGMKSLRFVPAKLHQDFSGNLHQIAHAKGAQPLSLNLGSVGETRAETAFEGGREGGRREGRRESAGGKGGRQGRDGEGMGGGLRGTGLRAFWDFVRAFSTAWRAGGRPEGQKVRAFVERL